MEELSKVKKFPGFLPKVKSNDVVSGFVKTTLAFCLATAILFVFYSQPLSWTRVRTTVPTSHVIKNLRSQNDAVVDAGDSPTGISHVLFGIGGSASTWHVRRRYTELWWRPGVTRGYVWLDKELPSGDTWPAASPPYRVSGDTSKFRYTCWYGSRSAIRMARIVKEAFELGMDDVRWFVMGDDDTVFYLENLLAVLRKYDHREMYYVGGNSESVEQDVIHSYTMGYGGGGFAVSYPLAKELVRILDGCIDRYASFYGSDQKVQGCISEIGVPLTRELGFHQVDIRGSPYGLLAAHPIAPLISLHHLDAVDPIFPGWTQVDSLKKLSAAYEADPGRTLQHSYCYDLTRNWSVSVSWGYTVQLYPSLLTSKALETKLRTFQTWRSWSNGPFTFNTRPVSSDACKQPVVYMLERVEGLTDGRTLSTYELAGAGPKARCERPEYSSVSTVRFVNVTASTLSPDVWSKAPRRQCCEVINAGDQGDNVVQVKIRGCNPFESVTPPT